MVLLSGCVGDKSSEPEEPPTGETVTITFDSQGGTEISPSVIEKGKKVVKPRNPTKTVDEYNVYIFECWTLNGEEFNFSTNVNEDIVLVARYKYTKYYLVTFDSQGGTIIKPKMVEENKRVEKPSDPEKPTDFFEYEFDYWTLDGVEFDFNTPITRNITLKAKYSEWGSLVP